MNQIQILQQYLDSASVLFISLNADGTVHYANPFACKTLGTTQEEIEGKNWFDHFIPESDRPQVKEVWQQIIDGNVDVMEYYENNIITITGEKRFIAWHNTAIYDSHGKLSRHISSGSDITDKTSVDALIESEKRAKAIFEQAAVGIARVAPDGRWLDVNRKLCEIVGYQRAELLTLTFQEITHPDDLNTDLKYVEEMLDNLIDTYTLEKRYIHKQGHTVWVNLTASLVKDSAGKPEHFISVVEDISSRKEIEEELYRSQKRLSEAQKVALLGSWELDTTTGELQWSDEVYEIFELDPIEFKPSYEGFLHAIHPDDRKRVDKGYSKSLENHTTYDSVHRLLMKDGRVKFVNERCQHTYDEKGNPLSSTGTIQDITEQQMLEKKFLQAQKMEAVGTLAGGIAHDFNNKLAAITGNIFLLKRKTKQQPELLENIKTIEKLSFEAAELVRQLLTFARVDRIEKSTFSLTSLMKESIKMHRVALPENIVFETDFNTDPLFIDGNATQIQQVLINIMNNARDALESEKKPRLTIHLEKVPADKAFRQAFPELKSKQHARITISDNGAGILKKNIEKIFEPFFTTKKVGKGTGLGLSMAYGAVKSHGGEISVTSKARQGTAFDIYLPLAKTIEGPTHVRDQRVSTGEHQTILLVDDDTEVLTAGKEVLSTLNYRVITARDGAEAISIFETHQSKISAVILDVVMPTMGGVAAANEIRKIRNDILIMFATGYDASSTLKSLPTNEIILSKPYSPEELSQTLAELFASKESASSLS